MAETVVEFSIVPSRLTRSTDMFCVGPFSNVRPNNAIIHDATSTKAKMRFGHNPLISSVNASQMFFDFIDEPACGCQ